jgi:hypothetical protein
MTAWWHTLGAPELSPDIRAAIIKEIREQTQSRSVQELTACRDRILLGLLSLRRDEA